MTVVTDIQSRLSYAHNMEILAADRDGLLEELHVLQVRLDDMQGHLVDMKLHLKKVQDQIRASRNGGTLPVSQPEPSPLLRPEMPESTKSCLDGLPTSQALIEYLTCESRDGCQSFKLSSLWCKSGFVGKKV